MTRRTLLLNVVVVAVSVLIALLLLEVMLRLNGVTGDQGRLSAYEFDEELGWRTKKSSRYYRSTAAYGHFTYYDAAGFPTDEQGLDKSPSKDAPSLALIGDSFVEGYYLPYDATVGRLIGVRVPQKQVINLGVSGYSPDQYLLTARRHLKGYRVTDVVLMFFSGNDLTYINTDRMQGYAKPVFNDGAFDKPANTPLADTRDGARENRGPLERLEDLADRSATFRTLKPLIGGLLRRGGFDGTFSQTPVFHEQGAMRKALGLIKRIQVEFPVERFVVYFVPVMEEIEQHEKFDHNLALFMSTCRDLGMPCYSLAGLLKNGATASQIFTRGEGHFSAYGSSLVADDIREILASKAP